MSSELSMDNDLFYEPEAGYWEDQDRLTFEANKLVDQWPGSDNPFISRMASRICERGFMHGVSLQSLTGIAGVLLAVSPKTVFRFLVVPIGPTLADLSVRLIDNSPSALVPIRADNACSVEMAFEWMVKRHARFDVSFSSDATFWIHAQ